jgi:PAS domain S-box-containing protein
MDQAQQEYPDDHPLRIFEVASIGMAQADPRTGCWLRVNRKMCAITGYTAPELLQKRVQELTHPEDRDKDWEAFQQVVRGEKPDYRIQKRYIRKDGSISWVNVNMTVIRDASGQAVRTVATIEDITEHKQAEESLKVFRALVDKSNETNMLLSKAIEQSAETIMITDSKATILYVNPAFEVTTGYTREEALGKNPRILKSERQDAEFYRRMWEKLARGEVWTGHFINRRKDHTLYKEEASISPVRDASGQIVNYVAVKRDVTHETELENQLNQARKMEAVGRLAGGVAHDFNNLLMGIQGYAEICLEQIDHDPPNRECLDEIQKAVQRSADITRQLLTFARRQSVAPKILDLNDAVANMLKLLRQLIGEDIHLAWLPGAGTMTVKIDPSQVDQILANLCINARDAIVGVGKIVLETTTIAIDSAFCERHAEAIPGTYVLLSVTDSGCGMAPETKAHIFEPFFSTKKVGQGTGLGLATVYGITRQNKGFILVESEPDKGTTFEIYLPRVLDPPSSSGGLKPEAPLKGRGETILLVEDESALRITCSRFLEMYGYRVLVADEPAKALKLAEQHSGEIHLLLTDVIMPGMDGRELARQLILRKPDIKVLFMSGYTTDMIASHGVSSLEKPLIQKPFTRFELSLKLREVLDIQPPRA